MVMMRGRRERKILFWTVLAPTQKKEFSLYNYHQKRGRKEGSRAKRRAIIPGAFYLIKQCGKSH